jgi:fumarate hydratase subunit alpha
MREIEASRITEEVARLCMEANFELEDDVQKALEKAHEAEESPAGREVLRQIIENSGIARSERMPMCQDTGLAVIFAEIGQDLHIAGGGFEEAINAGVRKPRGRFSQTPYVSTFSLTGLQIRHAKP